ncbi:MAG TPA: hypothetical protein VF796_07380 [Humisphaera sp.]
MNRRAVVAVAAAALSFSALSSDRAAAQPTTGPAAGAAAPADTPEQSAARTAARAFAKTLGEADVSKAKALFAGADEDFKLVEAAHAAMRTTAKFKAAAIKVFPDLAKRQSDDMTVEGLLARVERMPIKITGDEALFGDGLKLRKADGQWRVVDLYGSPMAKQLVPKIAAATTKVMEELTPEIEAGKFKTQQEFQEALQTRMRAAMQGAMPRPATRPAGK